MIEDIIYESIPFIMEVEYGAPGGTIIGYTLDNDGFDIKSMEVSNTFIT